LGFNIFYLSIEGHNIMGNVALTMSPDEALKQLMEGNKRFVAGKQEHPHESIQRRDKLCAGQEPIAALLACSDSRVSPSLIFDQGLGDLFVVRVAGNIVNDQNIGSLEYAAAHLNTPLIMVIGHTCCGAVNAVASGAKLEGRIGSLSDAIQPAVDKVKGQDGDLADNAAAESARMTAVQLRESQPVLADLVKAGKLKIVPAMYHLESGEVALV
jgi:carbonic anhydrase